MFLPNTETIIMSLIQFILKDKILSRKLHVQWYNKTNKTLNENVWKSKILKNSLLNILLIKLVYHGSYKSMPIA